jgi:hypothetical protein
MSLQGTEKEDRRIASLKAPKLGFHMMLLLILDLHPSYARPLLANAMLSEQFILSIYTGLIFSILIKF